MNYKVKRTDSLIHHGILGMKWGKRNGPSYPLLPGDHSTSEKKAGWRKSLEGGSDGGAVPAGGGGRKEDEDYKEVLDAFYEDMQKTIENYEKATGKKYDLQNAILDGNFKVILDEFTGMADKYTDEQIKQIRDIVKEHYNLGNKPRVRKRGDVTEGKGVQKREKDTIQHHGILGMKWGKRNGPPYPLTGTAKSTAERRVRTRSNALKKAKKTNINTLSDNELNRINNRLRSEQEFRRLTESGSKRTKELLFDLGTVTASGTALAVSIKTGNEYAAKVAGATLTAATLNTAKDIVSPEAYRQIENVVKKR